MKTIVFVVQRNDLVTKMILALYLVGIYIECIYMCVHMYIINLQVSVGGYIFSYFPCYLGLAMTNPFCLSPILTYS